MAWHDRFTKMKGFVIGLGGAWAHTITHDISTQMVHCHPVKMGLTTEVNGSLPHVALYSWASNLAFTVQYQSAMCYCIHVKDGLPQLGYKKHISGDSEKRG